MREITLCRKEMRRDLMKAYREVCADCPQGTTQIQVYEMVVNKPAPRFYIDPRSALQVLSPIMRGDRSALEQMKPLRRQMYEDLFEVVMRLSQKKDYWCKSLYIILKDAVLQPAPRFYINTMRMGQIWKEKTEESRQARLKKMKCTYEG